MKKIIIASAAMGGAALIAFGTSGTFASYQDTSQVKSSLAAGSIVLNVAGAQENANLNVTGLKPGTTTPLHYAYWIQNVLWALLYTAWEQARDYETPRHTALTLCLHTLRKAVAP